MPDLPVGYLSFSQVDTYLSCPRKYEWHYFVKPEIVGGSPALLLGSSGHKVIADILEAKMAGKHINIKTITKKHSQQLASELRTLANQLGEPIPVTELCSQHDRLIEQWAKDVLPEFDPTAVESKVECTIGGYPFLMYIDAIHKGKRVIDWKFVASAKSKYTLADSLQLSVYSIGTGLDEVGFGSLVKPRVGKEASWKPRVQVIHTMRTQAERDWAVEVVKSAADGIRKRHFPLCSPENFLCSDKYCEFYPICRGKGKAEDPSWLKAFG